MSLTERTPANSSNLHSYGYDADTQTLAIQFWDGKGDDRTPGKIYHYFEVPQAIFDGLDAAHSKGEFFYREIRKGGFRFNEQ